jgi:uncharacterized protein
VKANLRILLSAAALAVLAPIGLGQAGPALAKAPAAHGRQSVHPVSGLKVVPLRIRGHRFRVEVAETGAQQEKGLMFRTAMGPDEGMIFPRNPPSRAYFWMRNTVLPLDIVYIGPDRRILNIVNAIPYDETPLASAGAASAVLELNAGRTKALGIKPGDKVEW